MDLSKYTSNTALGQIAVVGSLPSNSSTESTHALDTAYSYASGGKAIFFAFLAQETGDLTDLWFKVAGYTGTWANTDGVINGEIRLGVATTGKPGTSLVGSFTVSLNGSTTGWIKKSGLSIALTAGTHYTLVLGDADGGSGTGGPNYVTIVRNYSASWIVHPHITNGYYSSDGFTTAGTAMGVSPAVVLKAGGVLMGGAAMSSTSQLTSSTRERGVRFKVPQRSVFIGAHVTVDTPPSGVKYRLLADSTAPDGSSLAELTLSIAVQSGSGIGRVLFPSASHYVLEPDTWYRCVYKPPTTTTVPRIANFGGNPDSDVLSVLLPLGGNCYYTVDNGSGGWTDDTTSGYAFGPMFVPNTDTGGSTNPKARAYIG